MGGTIRRPANGGPPIGPGRPQADRLSLAIWGMWVGWRGRGRRVLAGGSGTWLGAVTMSKTNRKRLIPSEAEELERLRRENEELKQLNEQLVGELGYLNLEKLAWESEVQRRGLRPPKGGASLKEAVDAVLSLWRPAFGQERVFERARDLAYGTLLNLGRHTVTGALCALGHDQRDWTADYRMFSKDRFSPEGLFRPLLRWAAAHRAQPYLALAVDDTQLKKTGKRITEARYLRDPQSPKFWPNLTWSLRCIQASALVTGSEPGPARAIPVACRLATPVAKPGRTASAEEWAAYREARKVATLGHCMAALVKTQREELDRTPGGRSVRLLVCADGAMATRTFLRNLPERTDFLIRARETTVLVEPAPPGGRRIYGDKLDSLETIRTGDAIPWIPVKAWAAGRTHEFKIKVVGPVYWRNGTGSKPLRLIIIKPLGYRPSQHHRILYRKHAYLLTSDLETPIATLLQTYVHRWEIEVNFRDQKTVLGMHQGQVRDPQSVENLPAFVAASYGALLIASAEAFGNERGHEYVRLPRWRNKPPIRPSLNDLLSRLRQEAWIDRPPPMSVQLPRDPELLGWPLPIDKPVLHARL